MAQETLIPLQWLVHTPPEQLPVTIITGFLGSGKTTLLNHLVQHPQMQDAVVLVNELGEIGLDHLLIERLTEEIILLQSGCICCQMHGDFTSTLTDLYEKRLAGELGEFSQVLVETTGIADPAPIIQSLLSNPQLAAHYRPGMVVATVDTVLGESQLNEFPETVRQVSLADRLLLTKIDQSEAQQRQSLATIVRQINPGAAISEIANGIIHPDDLFADLSPLPARQRGEPDTWSGFEHSNGITSFRITLDGPIEWNDFVDWFDDLLFSRSRQILRVKGLLRIAGKSGPVVIQSVQHMVYAPIELQQWPEEKRSSELTFITCDLNSNAVETSLRQHHLSASARELLALESCA